jgi:hypothetical protein
MRTGDLNENPPAPIIRPPAKLPGACPTRYTFS